MSRLGRKMLASFLSYGGHIKTFFWANVITPFECKYTFSFALSSFFAVCTNFNFKPNYTIANNVIYLHNVLAVNKLFLNCNNLLVCKLMVHDSSPILFTYEINFFLHITFHSKTLTELESKFTGLDISF